MLGVCDWPFSAGLDRAVRLIYIHMKHREAVYGLTKYVLYTR